MHQVIRMTENSSKQMLIWMIYKRSKTLKNIVIQVFQQLCIKGENCVHSILLVVKAGLVLTQTNAESEQSPLINELISLPRRGIPRGNKYCWSVITYGGSTISPSSEFCTREHTSVIQISPCSISSEIGGREGEYLFIYLVLYFMPSILLVVL